MNSLGPPSSMADADWMEGYDEFFDPPVSSIMECPICLLVLRDPVQTKCGHRFCKNCIMKVISEGSQRCPIDNEALNESMIFPDNFAKREILNYSVHCKNFQSRGCEWLGPLSKLQEHIAGCLYEYVACANNCGIEILRSDLEKHLKEECVNRIETCNYCKLKVVLKDLEDHHSRCNEYPVYCPNNCSPDTIVRKLLENHLANDCKKAEVSCPYEKMGCTFKDLREEVVLHIHKEGISHFSDLVEKFCQLKQAVETDVLPVNSLKQASSQDLAKMINKIANQVGELQNETQEAAEKGEQGVQLAEMYYSSLNVQMAKLNDGLKELTTRFDSRDAALSELQAKIWNGHFIWKIHNFEQVFKQAASGEVPAIHSVPFYSGIPGYKMCLRVNLNGVDSGASTHISMFVHLMQGDFDAILTWPFPGKITLIAVDQSDSDPLNVTETLIARPGLQAFLRPRTSRNHKGYGYVEMISHSVLKTRQYVKNNSFIIHVSVSTGEQ